MPETAHADAVARWKRLRHAFAASAAFKNFAEEEPPPPPNLWSRTDSVDNVSAPWRLRQSETSEAPPPPHAAHCPCCDKSPPPPLPQPTLDCEITSEGRLVSSDGAKLSPEVSMLSLRSLFHSCDSTPLVMRL